MECRSGARVSSGIRLFLFGSNEKRACFNKAKKASAEALHREPVVRVVVVDTLKNNGMDVSMNTDEGQRVLDEANEDVRMSAKKRRALETVSVSRDKKHQPTVVSSADGANVLNNLEQTKKKYEKQSNRSNTFIGDVAKALGTERFGSSSEYATFETKNGQIVTIRLANHNAHVSGFDHNGRDNGISIVISPKPNEGITNDGNAHIVEFYYDSIKLRRADGKPLAEIVHSIEQALYSGEFKDTTGLAERQEVNAEDIARLQKVYHGSQTDHVRFFRTANGEAYGFTVGGKIYIDPRIANSETPIHEYAHLWASALKHGNAAEWKNVVGLMKGTKVWDEVVKNYPELKDDNAIADEVIATFSGRRGAERLRKMAEDIPSGKAIEKTEAISTIAKVKRALDKFWKGVADMLHIHYTSAEEVADRVMKDLLDGVDPRKIATEQKKHEADNSAKKNSSANPVEGMERAATMYREEQRARLQKKENVKDANEESKSEDLFVSLQNKKGKEYYDTVTELARRVSEGKATFTSLPEEYESRRVISIAQAAGRAITSARLRESEEGGISIGDGTNDGEYPVDVLGNDGKDACEFEIETWAKQNGCWINEVDYSSKSYETNRTGLESTVYFVGDKFVKFVD